MESKTILALRALEKDMKPQYGTEVFAVGSYVREVLRKKKCGNVINIVLRHLPLPKAKQFLKAFGETRIETRHVTKEKLPSKVLHFTATGDTLSAQIELSSGGRKSGSQSGTASLKQDAQQRCFALDAMYMPINALKPNRVIDYVGGKSDIAARHILSLGNALPKFKKQPVQILRAFSLAAETGYSISNHVRHAINSSTKLLQKVPATAIRDELITILTSAKPSVQLRLMLKLGVLHAIMPELAKCAGCLQDKRYHKYDVFTHLIYTCDNIEADLVLRLAGLLHDVGKPDSKAVGPGGKVTFYRHEVFGAKIVPPMLYRLGFDKEIVDQVSHLVRMHMYHYTRDYTDAGVNRFIIAAGISADNVDNLDEFPLFKLRKAERLGNGFKKSGTTPRQKEFEARIARVYKTNSGFSIRNLAVDGATLLEVFCLEPGPEIGNILRHLLSYVNTDTSLNERKLLLHCALDYLLDKKENGEGKE
jgi:poly(A) polymerase/tRNA nucleotidyltransferase (CCA-adding enzyme)